MMAQSKTTNVRKGKFAKNKDLIVDLFIKLGSNMKFIPILAFYLNHRQL
jgi:hypothetical protein